MICIGFDGLNFINDEKEKNKKDNIIKKILKKNTEKEKKDLMLNDLIVKYQETKDDYYFNKIYEIYQPLIKNMSRSKDTLDINYSSELSYALFNAVNKFDVNNLTNANFNTFFLICAKNQINVINNSLNAQKRIANKNTISIQMNNSSNDNKEATLEDILQDLDSELNFQDIEFNMVLNSILKKLKKDEVIAIKMILKGYTLKEIGNYLGNITAPAVFTKLRRLKNNKNIKKDLISLLG